MDTTSAQRQSRHRARAKADAVAKALGWSPTAIVAVYRTKQGTTVAMDIDGARVPLTLDPTFDEVGAPAHSVGSLSDAVPDGTTRPAGNVTELASKRVRVPSAWPESDTWPITWNQFREYALEHGYDKRQYLVNARQLLAKHLKDDDKLQRKILTQMQAMTDALPDAPDWAQGIPIITDL